MPSGPAAVQTAMDMCTMGSGVPGTQVANIPKGSPVLAGSLLAGTILSNIPMGERGPFGPCMSMANPATASATSAALGVLTPTPCQALIAAKTPGNPCVLVNSTPAETQASMEQCSYAGTVSTMFAGQVTVQF